MLTNSYQVFKNLSPAINPKHIEGLSDMDFLGVARCATPLGPVDARAIKGLEKNYDSIYDFLAACEKAGYLAKESETLYDEEGNEILYEHQQPEPEPEEIPAAKKPAAKKPAAKKPAK